MGKDIKLEKYQKMQNDILTLMLDVKEQCQDTDEYKTIIMNLTSISKEINSITLKHITASVDDK